MASGTQHTEQLDQVIVRFAGDSGDGMQLTGDRFTTSSALLGNDLSLQLQQHHQHEGDEFQAFPSHGTSHSEFSKQSAQPE